MAGEVTFEYDLADFISFRNRAVCERVRRIRRSELAKHDNPEFRIQILDDPGDFYRAFADDIVGRIRDAANEGRDFVGLFPVGPMPQYEFAARRINNERLSCRHVHSFNMDEYANADGETAPPSWPGSFQRAMMKSFFGMIDLDLRPREENIHFPTKAKLGDYSAMIERPRRRPGLLRRNRLVRPRCLLGIAPRGGVRGRPQRLQASQRTPR